MFNSRVIQNAYLIQKISTNNKVKFVIWMFLALTLLDIYAHIPAAHPGCQGDISVFLKKNRNRRWEERSMVLGVRSLLFTVTGDHQVLKAPWGYFYIFSITVLFLFCQDRGWKLHNSHHTCKWPKGLLFVTRGLQSLPILYYLWDSLSWSPSRSATSRVATGNY